MKAEREQVMMKRKGEMVLWIRMITRFEMEQLISALLVIANRFCTKKMVMQSDHYNYVTLNTRGTTE